VPKSPVPDTKATSSNGAPNEVAVQAIKREDNKNKREDLNKEEASSPSGLAASTIPVIENDAFAARWQAFGEFLRSKSRPLYSIFPDLELCGIRRTTVYIAVPGAPERETLLTFKAELTLALSEFFGTTLTFEAGAKKEMDVKAGSPIVKNPEIGMPAPSKVLPNDRSELEIALVEQLGAQEV